MNLKARRRRVLISSISPGSGGVNTMTEFVTTILAGHGLEPVIAHYEPYSSTPRLSVPSFRLLQRSVGTECRTAFGGHECHAIGAWLPELEFTHYLATSHWRKLMDTCDAHIAVSGNVLATTPYWQTGRPYLAWVATDWDGDRRDRVKTFPWARRFLDTAVNGPVIRRLQKKLLTGGKILALSEFTARTLSEAAGVIVDAAVMPMPIDGSVFFPRPEATVPARIGFAGRIDDPRKNIGLLLETLAVLNRTGCSASAVLIGGRLTGEISRTVTRLGLEGHVEFISRLSHLELAERLRTFDVFVLPSHQEGLCIAAMEAMGCGVPVVSTRCGGPEEFVIDGETGILVESDPTCVAEATQRIIDDRGLRAKLGAGARKIVEERYGPGHAEDVFINGITKVFPAIQQG